MGMTEQQQEALEARVAELEARVEEAGRRLLFASATKGLAEAADTATLRHDLRVTLEDAGRALLFASETPDHGAPHHPPA